MWKLRNERGNGRGKVGENKNNNFCLVKGPQKKKNPKKKNPLGVAPIKIQNRGQLREKMEG